MNEPVIRLSDIVDLGASDAGQVSYVPPRSARTQTLADWLLEQIVADEAVIAQVCGAWSYHQSMLASESLHDRLTAEAIGPPRSAALAFATGQAPHPVGFDPAHVLAVCAAHREVVRLLVDFMEGDYAPWNEGILRALALAYADRPGFREEWRA